MIYNSVKILHKAVICVGFGTAMSTCYWTNYNPDRQKNFMESRKTQTVRWNFCHENGTQYIEALVQVSVCQFGLSCAGC